MERKSVGHRLRLFGLCVLLLCTGCTAPRHTTQETDDAPIRVVATIFPPYDFARAVAGEDAELFILLKPGMESHSYEPSPADILLIENCDLFIYNGGESDHWVEALLAGMDTSEMRILRMMDCVAGLTEETVEGMQTPHAHEHEEEEEGFTPEDVEYDEHIWTSPRNAAQITAAIADELIAADPEHAEAYRARTTAYLASLNELDQTFARIVAERERKMLIFGDRFPFRYFAAEYGLSYRAAFPGCSSESEPSAKTVAYLMDKVQEDQIPVVFYIEFSNQKIAEALEEETGAKPLLFHSCHNLTADEMERGVTYLELMKQNAENLKEALGDGNSDM